MSSLMYKLSYYTLKSYWAILDQCLTDADKSTTLEMSGVQSHNYNKNVKPSHVQRISSQPRVLLVIGKTFTQLTVIHKFQKWITVEGSQGWAIET